MRTSVITVILSAFVVLNGMATLVGRALGDPTLCAWPRWGHTPMAVSTAACFVVLGAAVFIAGVAAYRHIYAGKSHRSHTTGSRQ